MKIYPKYQKQNNANGIMIWNIDGMAFGCDFTGGEWGEYILLNDNSIAFNSSKGETGRIAGTFIELDELIKKYIQKYESGYEENHNKCEDLTFDSKYTYKRLQKELSEKLSIKIYN
jgi:hypothetical protein